MEPRSQGFVPAHPLVLVVCCALLGSGGCADATLAAGAKPEARSSGELAPSRGTETGSPGAGSGAPAVLVGDSSPMVAPGAGTVASTPPDSDGGAGRDAPAGSLTLSCTAVNTFGYVASAEGELDATGPRGLDGSLTLSGTISLRAGMYGDTLRAYPAVAVRGTVDASGQFANLDVAAGAQALTSLTLYFQGTIASSVNAADTTMYQTDCTSSAPHLPAATDLRPTGDVSFTDGPAMQAVLVDVVNVGTRPVSGDARVALGSVAVVGSLYAYDVAPGADPRVLPQHARGYFALALPLGTVRRCGAYALHIDVDHTLQAGAPDPFADDAVTGTAPCLSFTTPITARTLGEAPDAIIAGYSLDDIVNSRVVARTSDHRLCSACHYRTSGNVYHPPVDEGGTSTIAPTDLIDDPRVTTTHLPARSWAGGSAPGWAYQFTQHTAATDPGVKPAYLRAVMQRWIDDGAR
jgi:hypothetical protein